MSPSFLRLSRNWLKSLEKCWAHLYFTDFKTYEWVHQMRRSHLSLNSHLNLIDTLTSLMWSYKFCSWFFFLFFFFDLMLGQVPGENNMEIWMHHDSFIPFFLLQCETEKHKTLVFLHPRGHYCCSLIYTKIIWHEWGQA